MPFCIENLPAAISAAKQALRRQNPDYLQTFREVEARITREVAEVIDERESGGPVIPIVPYSDIAAGQVTDAAKDRIRRRGACVIRQVFSAAQTIQWNNELSTYVETNRLDEKLVWAAEDNISARWLHRSPRSTESIGQSRRSWPVRPNPSPTPASF